MSNGNGTEVKLYTALDLHKDLYLQYRQKGLSNMMSRLHPQLLPGDGGCDRNQFDLLSLLMQLMEKMQGSCGCRNEDDLIFPPIDRPILPPLVGMRGRFELPSDYKVPSNPNDSHVAKQVKEQYNSNLNFIRNQKEGRYAKGAYEYNVFHDADGKKHVQQWRTDGKPINNDSDSRIEYIMDKPGWFGQGDIEIDRFRQDGTLHNKTLFDLDRDPFRNPNGFESLTRKREAYDLSGTNIANWNSDKVFPDGSVYQILDRGKYKGWIPPNNSIPWWQSAQAFGNNIPFGSFFQMQEQYRYN